MTSKKVKAPKIDELDSYIPIEKYMKSKFSIIEVSIGESGKLGYMCLSKFAEAFFIPCADTIEVTDNFMYDLLLALIKKCEKDIKECDDTFQELQYPEQLCEFLIWFRQQAKNDPIKFIAFENTSIKGFGHYCNIEKIYEHPWFKPTTTEDVEQVG